MSTSDTAFTVVLSTGVVVITFNVSEVFTSRGVTVVFNTMIFVGIFLRSIDTSNISVAGVISAGIIIVTDNLFINTSYI
jgi:hypothetical protein